MAAANGTVAAKISEGASMASNQSSGVAAGERASPTKPALHQIYALPAPIRTFPLPTFYPSNPISLLHSVYTWLSHVLRPPPREPSVIHTGVWDPETRSVHVRDESSIRALWEQGFYGKGSLSRSEPNWLKRELARRGSPEGKTVSEARTEMRREERRLAKWERAKAELEAIERQRLAEAASQASDSGSSKLAGGLSKPAEVADTSANSAHSTVVEPAGTVEGTSAEAAPAEAARSPHVGAQPASHARNWDFKPPVGPAELLALPNSLAKPKCPEDGSISDRLRKHPLDPKPPVGPAELLMLPNSNAELIGPVSRPVGGLAVSESETSAPDQRVLQTALDPNGHAKAFDSQPSTNGIADGVVSKASASVASQDVDEMFINGTAENESVEERSSPPSMLSDGPTSDSSAPGLEGDVSQPQERRKSVRFSPTVKSAASLRSDPPSPGRSADLSSKIVSSALPNGGGVATLEPEVPSPIPPAAAPGKSSTSDVSQDTSTSVVNREHFQLAPEEAFFLAFSLGALKVVDPVTGSPISTEHLLQLFRAHSYFPPRLASSDLRPDDPFLVNYAVYHHFRSLGWVPRHGIKFGVDWILYQRGPVFDHSEFGVMVMPAYSDPAWEGYSHEEPKRSWSWLMGVNRVLSHVLKSLVLVYVDLPPPAVFEKEMQRGGIAAALKKYTIREVMVRRFSVNRNR
ncbi:uncharacterized protein P884DRAFT_270702 [Thermothelomyces heterothallicus CBS 202.75]|uniref:uncharacterized protein n=1 Tax=Thermothelomyces heterothallicus CBS 202.75 TaxID=1149848 RepID=UPI003744338E